MFSTLGSKVPTRATVATCLDVAPVVAMRVFKRARLEFRPPVQSVIFISNSASVSAILDSMFAPTTTTTPVATLLLLAWLLAATTAADDGSASVTPNLEIPLLREKSGVSALNPILQDRPLLQIPFHLIVDKAAYRLLGSDVYTVQRYCVRLMSIINRAYRQLFIQVVLVRLEIWSRGDGFTIGNHSVTTYNDTLDFIQRREIVRAGGDIFGLDVALTTHTQLLTGVKQYDAQGKSKLGRATLGSICTKDNVSVVRLFDVCEVRRQATTCMHELGHALGLRHTPVPCSVCIMSPNIASGPSQNLWSLENAEEFSKIVSGKRCLFIPRPPAQFRRDDMLDAPRAEVEADRKSGHSRCPGVKRAFES
jgi:Reprolysin (M12B) family zinc metalloprotease